MTYRGDPTGKKGSLSDGEESRLVPRIHRPGLEPDPAIPAPGSLYGPPMEYGEEGGEGGR